MPDAGMAPLDNSIQNWSKYKKVINFFLQILSLVQAPRQQLNWAPLLYCCFLAGEKFSPEIIYLKFENISTS